MIRADDELTIVCLKDRIPASLHHFNASKRLAIASSIELTEEL